MQFVVGWCVAECCNDHNGLMADSTIYGPIHMFTVCSLRTQSMRCRGPLNARVGYWCVKGWWWLNIGGLGGPSYDSLYGMFIGAVMPALVGGSGLGVTGVEYVVTCFVGVWGAWVGASCTDACCGKKIVFGTGRGNAAVSRIVAIFLISKRWSGLADVLNSSKVCLSKFSN